MNITIRKAEERDFPDILFLLKEFSVFQKTPEKLTITLEGMIVDQAIFTCLVAQADNGEIAGFATYFFSFYSWTGKGLYLDDLYVKESFRNMEIGKKLFSAVGDIARRERCRSMRWLVSGWNTHAIEFYKKIGAIVDQTDLNCTLMLKP